MSRNEKTSPDIGTDAGIILQASPGVYRWRGHNHVRVSLDLWQRCQKVAGSALTQTPNRKLSPRGDMRLDRAAELERKPKRKARAKAKR